ncbi:hypothetical protein ACFX2I_038854 [Malus domestica]
MPVAEALASGHALSLSSNIFAHLFRCLAETTIHKINPYQNGPIGSFNSDCKFTSPPFGRQSSISCQRKRLGLSWPPDQHPITKPKRYLDIFSPLMTFPTTSS